MNPAYDLNEIFLENLGFVKKEKLPGHDKCVFRYFNLPNREKGIDLIYVEEFRILSIEEFQIDSTTGNTQFRNTIVGMFHIESDEDLAFIFSKNVRLKFIFSTGKRRRIGC